MVAILKVLRMGKEMRILSFGLVIGLCSCEKGRLGQNETDLEEVKTGQKLTLQKEYRV
ncbi:putative lipoprotein [Leptospira santarosai str. AIM]|nr:putative lipoprotein [Leptospira santarosai str. AIM]